MAGPAFAQTVTTRPLLFSFGGSETPQGSFSNLLAFGVAVDDATGHIYVDDRGRQAVDVFDSSGNYLSQISLPASNSSGASGIAVDNSGGPADGNVYVSDDDDTSYVYAFDSAGNLLYKFDGSETSGGEFHPVGLAVDSAGNLLIEQGPFGYVGHIYKYATTANSASFVSQIDEPPADEHGHVTPTFTGTMASDGGANFYVNFAGGITQKRDLATNTVLTSYPSIGALDEMALTVDRSDGTVFFGDGPSVTEYSNGGTFVRRFGGNLGSDLTGLAVDQANGRLIAVDNVHHRVDVYGQPTDATAPDLSLGSTTPGYFAADLSATINPLGAPGAYRFEYRAHGASTWKTTAPQDAGSGSSDVPVSFHLTGLEQDTTYDLRMVGVATETGAIATSPTQSFHTEPVPLPSVSAPSGVTSNSATFQGAVEPQGVKAGWHFEYSADGTNWTSLPAEDSDVLGGLVTTSPGSGTLTVRAAGGTLAFAFRSSKAEKTEATPPLAYNASAAEVQSALEALSLIGAGNVTVSGGPGDATGSSPYQIVFTGSLTNIEFGSLSVDLRQLIPATSVPVSQTATGLNPNTTYQVRLAVDYGGGIGEKSFGSLGTVTSGELSFLTAAEPPRVSLASPSHVLDKSATLEAAVDPRHSPTTYHFEFGADEGYGTVLPAGKDGDAGSQLGPEAVYAHVSGLEPETTYHFRVVASNPAGKTETEDTSFTTRSEEEVDWPARDVELVNPPDKGNQPVYPPRLSIGGILGGVSPVTADGNRVLWETASGSPGGPTGALEINRAEYTDGGWMSRPLLPPVTELPGEGEFWFSPLAVSPDQSSFVFSSGSSILANTRGTLVQVDDHQHAVTLGSFSIEEGGRIAPALLAGNGGWTVRGGGTPSPFGQGPLVVYGPDGVAHAIDVPACGYQQIMGSTSAGTWFSADASRIFIYSSGDTDCSAPRGIYMIDRVTGARSLVSGSQTAAVTFLRANQAGTELLFNKSGDIYRWSEEDGSECVSCGSGYTVDNFTGLKTGVGGIPIGGVSADLSHVYFCGPTPAGLPPLPSSSNESQECSIYVWSSHGIHFVARAEQVVNFGGDLPSQSDDQGDRFTFASVAPATADPTGWDRAPSEFGNGPHTTQLYEYDDNSGVVECLTCSQPPSGGLPQPQVILVDNHWSVSADGHTIAFATNSKLVSSDINNRFDVYEWHNGMIRLVTDGESDFAEGQSGLPRVFGLSADGRALFYSEAGAHLTGRERDNYSNLYDGRVGALSAPPPTPPTPCVEDACQGPLVTPPTPDDIASPDFAGSGNLASKHRPPHRHRRKHHHRRSRRANHRHGGAK